MDIGLPSRLAEWQWGYPRLPTSSHFLNAPLEESSKGRPEKVGFWVWPNPNLFATANILSPPKCTLLTSLHMAKNPGGWGWHWCWCGVKFGRGQIHSSECFCTFKTSLCRPGPSALGEGLVSNKFIPWSPKVVILTYFQQTSKLPLVSRTWKSIDVQFSILSISLLGLYINIRNIKLFTYLLIRVNIQS